MGSMISPIRNVPALVLLSLVLVGGAAGTGQAPGASGWATATGNWRAHTVYQLNGSAPPVALAARYQLVTEALDKQTRVPYMAWIPEKNGVLMTFLSDTTVSTFSADLGATWTAPRPCGASLGLTYLGNGKAISLGETIQCASDDYGETWRQVGEAQTVHGKPAYTWDPALVDRDQGGRVVRLVSTCWALNSPAWWDAQGYIKFSTDEGATWTAPAAVPEWLGANEIVLVRAANGDLVAACRTGPPERLRDAEDHYCGLGVSISRDNGTTWSKIRMLYAWGRHHQSLAVLPAGDIVMAYVVRRGYPNRKDGLMQFGIEAIVSRDHGASWDLDHKYILATWAGDSTSFSAPQGTTTVLLPDGSLLTAFGSGSRARFDPVTQQHTPRDIGLVNWRVSSGELRRATRIARARFDSDLRNKFDLNAFRDSLASQVPPATRNIAVTRQNVQLTSSPHSSGTLEQLLRDRAAPAPQDPYFYPPIWPIVVFEPTPAWVAISWPVEHVIDTVIIYPGDPTAAVEHYPSNECVPLDYRLQYQNGGSDWQDLVAEVRNAPRFADWRRADPDGSKSDFRYVQTFPPVAVTAVRLLMTRSSDSGKRINSDGKVIIPEDKRATMLRRIEVYEAPARRGPLARLGWR
jgi:hypothetical protein